MTYLNAGWEQEWVQRGPRPLDKEMGAYKYVVYREEGQGVANLVQKHSGKIYSGFEHTLVEFIVSGSGSMIKHSELSTEYLQI